MSKLEVSKWKKQEFKIIAPILPGVTISEMEKRIRDAIMGMYMDMQLSQSRRNADVQVKGTGK